MSKFTIGIDEAGRGPLAGPLAVCALALSDESEIFLSEKLRDSKKMSEKKRDEIFLKIQEEARVGKIKYSVAFVAADKIDELGMQRALEVATKKVIEKVAVQNTDTILLDGSLKAPEIYSNQTTITRGDESEPAIALASVVAKVSRDAKMKKLGTIFPQYGFEQHKGYGTKAHIAAIIESGLTSEHRKSFCKNIFPN